MTASKETQATAKVAANKAATKNSQNARQQSAASKRSASTPAKKPTATQAKPTVANVDKQDKPTGAKVASETHIADRIKLFKTRRVWPD